MADVATTMKSWQERVYDERHELIIKEAKLKHFIATAQIPTEEYNLLKDQQSIMVDYIGILTKRINRWQQR